MAPRMMARGMAAPARAPARPCSRGAPRAVAGESRIGKMPVAIPKGVDVKVDGQFVSAKGPKGELSRSFHELIELTHDKDAGLLLVKPKNESRKGKELHGLSRSLANNLVVGVSEGFEVNLQLIGVGYRAKLDGSKGIVLSLGFSHDVTMAFPDGVKAEVDKAGTGVKITGPNKEHVTQFAADIRKYRPPEPYKGKGVHYLGEQIIRKEGKSGSEFLLQIIP